MTEEGRWGLLIVFKAAIYCDRHVLLRRAIPSAWRRFGRGKRGVTVEKDQGFI
jgi:hypothetical protein